MNKPQLDNHISAKLNQSIEAIFNHILEMGHLVATQLESAQKAVLQNNYEVAHHIIETDQTINHFELEIGRLCNLILARQQLHATDLRLIIACIRIAIHLERMGDEITKIAKLVLATEDNTSAANLTGYDDLMTIIDHSLHMLQATMESFQSMCIDAFADIITREESVDQLYDQATLEVKKALKSTPPHQPLLIDMLTALRAVERIADHALNMMEIIIYFVNGKEIRILNKDHLMAYLQNEKH